MLGVQDVAAAKLAVWMESESDLPLCVLAFQLQTWGLMRALDAAAEWRGDGQGNDVVSLSGGASVAQAEVSGSPMAAKWNCANSSAQQLPQELRLRLVLDVLAVLSHAFAIDGLEELMQHFAGDYITYVLLMVGRQYISGV